MDERLIQQQEQELAKTGRYYLHVCFMTIPLLCMACFLYGLRPLLLCGAALLTGNLCDRLVSLLRRRVYRAGDFSNESFALIIALLMPATVDWYVVIMAVLAGVLIGKEVFGGYGSYPFNPAAVGYAVAAVSWPEQVFRYPQPYTNIPLWDVTGVPVSSTISDTLRSGGSLNISAISLVLGEYAAPMGTGAALILLACGLFLWLQKDVRLSASVSFVVTCALIAFLPRRLSASSCMAKGLVVVRAPTHSTSIPAFRAASTCLGVATSVAVSMPVSSFTLCIQGSAFSPLPSKPPGFVRGFHIPALKIFTPFDAKPTAVVITCSSVSALQGPAITRGRLASIPGKFNG